MKSFDKSYEWLERAKKVIPYPYNQTFSKGPDQYVQGVSPVFADWGAGPSLFDADNNRYIDLVMGLMPLILGYSHFYSSDMNPVAPDPIYSLPHPKEVELSELLCDVIPCAEMVRLGKNGSDATTAAIRLARAITGKDIVLQCGYHGWHDWSIANSFRNKGVPEVVRKLTIPFEYNDFELFSTLITHHYGQIACVIMEPVQFVAPKYSGIPYTKNLTVGFLQYVRKYTERNDILLIFDEMITGFRFALGGAQEYFNVTPDLACFGKAMANGWPISAVVGKREYMEEFANIHFSSTFGGEVHSINAALQTINFIEENDVVGHLWSIGECLQDELSKLIVRYGLMDLVALEGYPVRFQMVVEDNLVKSFISQELIQRGVLWLGSFNLSYAHKQEHVEKVVSAFDEVFSLLSRLDVNILDAYIEGESIKPKMNVRDE